MDVIDILTEFALVANRSWLDAAEGPKKDLMAELADSLRKAADEGRRETEGWRSADALHVRHDRGRVGRLLIDV